jgi:hypothetical protein
MGGAAAVAAALRRAVLRAPVFRRAFRNTGHASRLRVVPHAAFRPSLLHGFFFLQPADEAAHAGAQTPGAKRFTAPERRPDG